MRSISLAEAKARLSELVECAALGDTIAITRRGKEVARLISARGPRKAIDVAALRAVTDAMPSRGEGAGSFLRALRDGDRY